MTKKKVRDRATQKSSDGRGHRGRRSARTLGTALRAAASLVADAKERGDWACCCWAIREAGAIRAHGAFEELFEPQILYPTHGGELTLWWPPGECDERITALGFAAAMADTGDL